MNHFHRGLLGFHKHLFPCLANKNKNLYNIYEVCFVNISELVLSLVIYLKAFIYENVSKSKNQIILQ